MALDSLSRVPGQVTSLSSNGSNFSGAPVEARHGLVNGDLRVSDRGALRRKHSRRPIRLRAILYRDEVFTPVVVRDISRGGAGISVRDCLTRNDEVTLSLLDGRHFRGRVKWWLGGFCGIQFLDLLPEAEPILHGRLGSRQVADSGA